MRLFICKHVCPKAVFSIQLSYKMKEPEVSTMKEMTAVIFTSNKLCHGLIFKLERIFFGGQPITEVPMRFRPKRSKLLAVQNSIQGRKIRVVGKIPTIHKYEEYWMAKNCTVDVRTNPDQEFGLSLCVQARCYQIKSFK